jgi:uncharacterized protein YbjT (DUF2867 family)
MPEPAAPSENATPAPAAPVTEAAPATEALATEVVPDLAEEKPGKAQLIALAGEMSFCGRAAAGALLKRGFTVRALCPDEAAEQAVRAGTAKVFEALTEAERATALQFVRGTIESPDALGALLQGAHDACIFSPITMDGRRYRPSQYLEDVKTFTTAAHQAGARKVVCHSALGVSQKPGSETLRESAAAEAVVKSSGVQGYLLRTGPLMGLGDAFLERFLVQARAGSPVACVLGYGSTLAQPLHVDDFACCVVRMFLDKPTDLTPGAYELAGPDTVAYLDLLDLALARVKRAKLKVHAPLFALKLSTMVCRSRTFKERVALLYEAFCTDKNDAPRMLEPRQKLISVSRTFDELVPAQAPTSPLSTL